VRLGEAVELPAWYLNQVVDDVAGSGRSPTVGIRVYVSRYGHRMQVAVRVRDLHVDERQVLIAAKRLERRIFVEIR